mmetsp:Transcript_44048/g.88307  ORF Transcript_44048/g.88307 Transcript_44048/m.88307 type:complete len:173 (+) Transcript_44048:61-579(+)
MADSMKKQAFGQLSSSLDKQKDLEAAAKEREREAAEAEKQRKALAAILEEKKAREKAIAVKEKKLADLAAKKAALELQAAGIKSKTKTTVFSPNSSHRRVPKTVPASSSVSSSSSKQSAVAVAPPSKGTSASGGKDARDTGKSRSGVSTTFTVVSLLAVLLAILQLMAGFGF